MEKVNKDLRPDHCGVLFEKINDTLFLATVDAELDEIMPIVKGQIRSFNNEGFSVMMQKFTPHESICFISQGADREAIVNALEEKANDSSILY